MSTPMTWDDVQDAIGHHRAGHLQLRAVAWSFRRFRQQDGRDVTPADLMESAGASQTAAYRAIQEINRHSRIPGNSRFPVPGKREKPFPESGTRPPPPPIEERELRRESYSSPPARTREEPADLEPFAAPPEPLRGMPGPPGPNSPQALALRAKFAGCGTAPGKVRDNYGEIAARLCGMYAAEWVDIAMTCQLLLWGNTPGQPNLSATLRRWEVAGEVEADWLAAYKPEPRAPLPLRPTGTAGRPNPADFLPENW
jgi:hypothetical protein